MTATIAIDGRRLPLPVADPAKVREIANAVHRINRLGVDLTDLGSPFGTDEQVAA